MTRAGDGTATSGHTFPRHVWVNLTGGSSPSCPGIILDWRQHKGRWEALVVYAEGGGNIAVRATTGWVDAAHVRLRED